MPKALTFFTIALFIPLSAVLFVAALPARAQTDFVPAREQGTPLPGQDNNEQNGQGPGWVQAFESCTEFQTTFESSIADINDALVRKQLDEQASREVARIMKAREDVNKLVASVYNELRTQQILQDMPVDNPDFENFIQTIGIMAIDDNNDESNDLCKASYEVRADMMGVGINQCVAVAQEARIITNQDDYIYEESIRRAMDMLFCYLGDWRHFPIAATNDPTNCAQLGLDDQCSVDEVWRELGKRVGLSENYYNDADGTLSSNKAAFGDDQHVFNLCEGMRSLGGKCAADILRDFIKYSTIDKITRKDRTVILAPPQTWYTPGRCRIIDSFLPTAGEFLNPPQNPTPYTKSIKSLDLVNLQYLFADPKNIQNSNEVIRYLFESNFGNPTLTKRTSEMSPAEFTVERELAAINTPENNYSGLLQKAEELGHSIIKEFTELRKLQYASGEGLRDATVRIGWHDYEWDAITNPDANKIIGGDFLGKYAALDLPVENAKHPNKIFKPLGCYWRDEEEGSIEAQKLKQGDIPFCVGEAASAFEAKKGGAKANGKTFYFDTGIVLSPVAILKDKLQSAIQAQFDLARDTFALADTSNPLLSRLIEKKKTPVGECTSTTLEWVAPSINHLVAPFEDVETRLQRSINPLTQEDYTQESHIPYVIGNYFNAFYNDVFQLYHTSFPDILGRWFQVDDIEDPESDTYHKVSYDSVYGRISPLSEIAVLFDDSGPGGLSPAPPSPGPSPSPGPIGPLPGGCAALASTFEKVASSTGVDKCLLVAIAGAESTCGAKMGPSPAKAYGLMQILPSTASLLAGRTVTGSELLSNNQLSIELAAKYFKSAANLLGTYRPKGFDIGNAFTQSGQTVSYDSFTYDKGNDDLIASYNAGLGDKKPPKTPFKVSVDCSDTVTPMWQCNINSGGYGRETQPYVLKVQKFQNQCNGGPPL